MYSLYLNFGLNESTFKILLLICLVLWNYFPLVMFAYVDERWNLAESCRDGL